MMDEFEMSLRIAELEDELEKIRSKYQQQKYHLAAMTEIDCPYCRGTFMVDLGYAPIHPKVADTRAFAEVHCPYCIKEIWYRI